MFMRMSQGVEWAIHTLLALSWLEDDACISTAQFAAGFDLSPTYLNKQLQALVHAGLLESQAGVKGGFRLGKPAESITLMDVVVAIEGSVTAFRCTEIRRRGLGETQPSSYFRQPCAVHQAMARAELAWRQALANQTVADIRATADTHARGMRKDVESFFSRG